jgi:sigma-E factor negative regulatory protein RseC
MQQQVKVVRTDPDGMAQVLHIRESACSGDCHKCSGCGAVQQKMLFSARNPICAQVGDLVVVESESTSVLTAALVLYIMPLILFFAGCIVGWILWEQMLLTGGIAFIMGILLAVVYDRKVLRKKEIVYTITGYANS